MAANNTLDVDAGMECDERYVIWIEGYSDYYSRYVRSFGVYLDTTDDIYSARFFKNFETAQKNAEKIRKHIKKCLPKDKGSVKVLELYIEIEGIVI